MNRMKRRKEIDKTSLIIRIVGGILILLIAAVCILLVFRRIGKSRMSSVIADSGHIDIGEAPDNPELILDENQILYQGQVYEQNEDLISILVMGIDKETVVTVGGQSWNADAASAYSGGQADALFLLLINPHDETVRLLNINRNTMADVDVWDESGNYMGVYTKQIALQHGYGDGGEESCVHQVKAVSRLLHGIPIHSYVAIEMDAIPEMNDAVGGVTVSVLDDVIYPEYNMDLHQGDLVTLTGRQAYWYVRLRNENIFNSNELRQQRQKQYIQAFVTKVREAAREDLNVPIEIYRILDKYMVTDINESSFSYLVTETYAYDFQLDNIYSLQGEVIQGNQFEEFYADDDAMQELIVELFYEPTGD
ncbi:MAG: LCP family protein [Lachnospiraceae bacterium]|nr:LCP family protein [Lachnospiraceae bacterium]